MHNELPHETRRYAQLEKIHASELQRLRIPIAPVESWQACVVEGEGDQDLQILLCLGVPFFGAVIDASISSVAQLRGTRDDKIGLRIPVGVAVGMSKRILHSFDPAALRSSDQQDLP